MSEPLVDIRDLSVSFKTLDGVVHAVKRVSLRIDRGEILALVGELEARGVFARPLEVDFASHCFHMDPLLAAFREGLSGIEPKPASIPSLSALMRAQCSSVYFFVRRADSL